MTVSRPDREGSAVAKVVRGTRLLLTAQVFAALLGLLATAIVVWQMVPLVAERSQLQGELTSARDQIQQARRETDGVRSDLETALAKFNGLSKESADARKEVAYLRLQLRELTNSIDIDRAIAQLKGVKNPRLNVAMVGGNRLGTDSVFAIEIEANISGELFLFEIDTQNRAFQLYPNRFSNTKPITAGAKIRLPDPSDGFTLRVSPPVGSEVVIAIVVPQNSSILRPDVGQGDDPIFPQIKAPAAFFSDLALWLNNIGSKNSIGIVEFEVIGLVGD